MAVRDCPLTHYAWKNLLAWHRHEVCQRWLTFANFLADMGEKPKGMCLRRRNMNRVYEKTNCWWGRQPGGTVSGTSKHVRRLTHDGKTRTSRWWADHLGISISTLNKRLRRHSVADALKMEPMIPGRNRKYAKGK